MWWIWRRGGSAYLARFAPSVNLPANPDGIRSVLTALAGFVFVSSAFTAVGRWLV